MPKRRNLWPLKSDILIMDKMCSYDNHDSHILLRRKLAQNLLRKISFTFIERKDNAQKSLARFLGGLKRASPSSRDHFRLFLNRYKENTQSTLLCLHYSFIVGRNNVTIVTVQFLLIVLFFLFFFCKKITCVNII